MAAVFNYSESTARPNKARNIPPRHSSTFSRGALYLSRCSVMLMMIFVERYPYQAHLGNGALQRRWQSQSGGRPTSAGIEN